MPAKVSCSLGKVLMLFLLLGADGAIAQPACSKVGPDLRVTDVSGLSAEPSLVWTGTEYAQSWTDGRDNNGSGDEEIYFARLDSSGTKIGEDVRITNVTDSYSTRPSLVWTGSEYAVSWSDYRDFNDEIYFARIDSSGSKIGSDVRVTNAVGTSFYSHLAWTGSEFGLVWGDTRDGNYEIYFARLDPNGVKIGNDLRVTNDPAASYARSLVWTGSEYGLAWIDLRDGNSEIYFTRLDDAGTKIGSDVRVTSDPAGSTDPSLSWNGSGYGLAWADQRDGNYEIYFARLDSVGVKMGGDVRVTNDPAYSWEPSVVWGGGGYTISWSDRRDSNGADEEIYVARLDSTGAKIGDDIRITYDPDDSTQPSLVWAADEYAVAWRDDRDGDLEIYFARLSCYTLCNEADLEICNGLDDDCNGVVDEGCDDDADGYCDAALTTIGAPPVCQNGVGDCDDSDPTVFPGAEEICDDVDNQCAGVADLGCDDDDDDYCEAGMTLVGTPSICSRGGGDCDDTERHKYPFAPELCDGIDNQCPLARSAGSTDEVCTNDRDNDGFDDTVDNCRGVANPLQIDGDDDDAGDACDCQPANSAVFPDAPELCDGIDNQCPGDLGWDIVDEACPTGEERARIIAELSALIDAVDDYLDATISRYAHRIAPVLVQLNEPGSEAESIAMLSKLVTAPYGEYAKLLTGFDSGPPWALVSEWARVMAESGHHVYIGDRLAATLGVFPQGAMAADFEAFVYNSWLTKRQAASYSCGECGIAALSAILNFALNQTLQALPDPLPAGYPAVELTAAVRRLRRGFESVTPASVDSGWFPEQPMVWQIPGRCGRNLGLIGGSGGSVEHVVAVGASMSSVEAWEDSLALFCLGSSVAAPTVKVVSFFVGSVLGPAAADLVWHGIEASCETAGWITATYAAGVNKAAIDSIARAHSALSVEFAQVSEAFLSLLAEVSSSQDQDCSDQLIVHPVAGPTGVSGDPNGAAWWYGNVFIENQDPVLPATASYLVRVMTQQGGRKAAASIAYDGEIVLAPLATHQVPIQVAIPGPSLTKTQNYGLEVDVVTSGGLFGSSIPISYEIAEETAAFGTTADDRRILVRSEARTGDNNEHLLTVDPGREYVQLDLHWTSGDLDLHVYDALDRHVGWNYAGSTMELEIPGSVHSGVDSRPESVRVPVDPGDILTIQVVGVDTDGPSTYEIHAVQEGPKPATVEFMHDRIRTISLNNGPADGVGELVEVARQESALVTLSATDLVGTSETVPASSVTLTPGSVTVNPGESAGFTVSVDPGAVPAGLYEGVLSGTYGPTTVVTTLQLALGCDSTDYDADGLGDACDSDDDDDGVEDSMDCAPLSQAISMLPAESGALSWSDKTRLEWTPGGQAAVFNVYTTTIGNLEGGWSCTAHALPRPWFDAADPMASEVHGFLVTSLNECGESGAGAASDGQPRTIDECP